jgi:hypothetical protein
MTLQDLTGERFGLLVVTKKAEDLIRTDGGGSLRRWFCHCDCGNDKIVLEQGLRAVAKGRGTKSCGCLKYQWSIFPGRKLTKEERAMRQRARRYNLSPEKIETILAKGCGVCGSHEGLHIDHDHTTDQVRGALCNRHNNGIGLFWDSPHELELAAEYVRGNGRISLIPHAVRHTLFRWSFWLGLTMGFPFEHWLWLYVWPFKLVTQWLGL